MAQDYFGKGIPTMSGFDLYSKKPLDNRTVVDNITDLQSIPDSSIYEGLKIYVKSEQTYYFFDGTNWVENKGIDSDARLDINNINKNKQDIVTGTTDQIAGFDSNGKLTAIDFPYKFQVITQDEYDALTDPDSSTLYIIEV